MTMRARRHRKRTVLLSLALGLAPVALAFSFVSRAFATETSGTNQAARTPVSPREFYNDGAKKLLAGKLGEAESSFQVAVASQNDRIQIPALYNLGEVRYLQGLKEFINGPSKNAVSERSQRAEEHADGAIHAADDALAGDDIPTLVTAYQQGRGALKDIKAATAAVRKAMESYRNVLLKWQRASGDFKSTVELQSSDDDARHNAEVVDRSIARLVDIQQIAMQSLAAMGKQKGDLKEKMGKIRKRLPADAGDQMKGGDGDDDDEDEGKPKGPEAGTQEGPSRDGQEQR